MNIVATADWIAVANIATPIVCGFVGYLVKRAINDMDRRVAAVERQNQDDQQARQVYVEQHRLEHRQLEDDVVGKEDWLRESGLARQRQEKIIEDLNVIKGKQDAGIEIAAAVAAALNREGRKPKTETAADEKRS
jgi:hypothetical protein